MPRAGLTPERVVAEAEVLADEVGLGAMTLAELAKRLGVRLPSLYKHVSGMDGVQRELSVRAMRELGQVMARATTGRSGDDAVIALMNASRQWIKEHPGRYTATVRAPAPEEEALHTAAVEGLEVILDVLRGYGLEGADLVDAARVLRSTLHGFATLETAGGFGMPADVNRSYDLLVAGLCRNLAAWPRT